MSTPTKPPANPDEIRIAVLRPLLAGAGQRAPGAQERVLIAREPGQLGGCDITWVRQRRAFRVQHFEPSAGKPDGEPKWIPEGGVGEYTEAT